MSYIAESFDSQIEQKKLPASLATTIVSDEICRVVIIVQPCIEIIKRPNRPLLTGHDPLPAPSQRKQNGGYARRHQFLKYDHHEPNGWPVGVLGKLKTILNVVPDGS